MLKMKEKLDSCCKKLENCSGGMYISNPYNVKLQTSSLKVSQQKTYEYFISCSTEKKLTLRVKCLYSEFFWSVFSRIRTE